MFNKVTLIGRLGQNAEAKTAQNNREYVGNIATNAASRRTSPMKAQLFVLATVLAFGSLTANHVRAQANQPPIPDVVDATHATKDSGAFFDSFFKAKSGSGSNSC